MVSLLHFSSHDWIEHLCNKGLTGRMFTNGKELETDGTREMSSSAFLRLRWEDPIQYDSSHSRLSTMLTLCSLKYNYGSCGALPHIHGMETADEEKHIMGLDFGDVRCAFVSLACFARHPLLIDLVLLRLHSSRSTICAILPNYPTSRTHGRQF